MWRQEYIPCDKQIHIKIPKAELQMIRDRMAQTCLSYGHHGYTCFTARRIDVSEVSSTAPHTLTESCHMKYRSVHHMMSHQP